MGVEVSILTPRWNGLTAIEEINGAKIQRVNIQNYGSRKIKFLTSAFSLFWRFLIEHHSYDLVHAVSQYSLYLPTFLIAKLLGKPVIIDFTVMQSSKQSLVGRLLSRLNIVVFSMMDAYIGNSPRLVRQMQERGLSPEKCHLISNGVFTDIFRPLTPTQRKKLRGELGLQDNAFHLLFVGNFLHRKGVDILVQTMIQLCETLDDIQLIIIGKHDFQENEDANHFATEQKQIILENSLDSRIRFLGLLEHSEYLHWLQACDIFFFPSRREGFGRVIAEAMSVGIPVVCSPIEGIVYDLFEPGISGIVVEDSEPESFSREIERLAADEALRASIGKEARKMAVEKFDEKKIVGDFRRLYEEVLAIG